jgi:phenylpropionate dioxygenase-like ring-hydroxylating dioxygenase large terminal subunit
MCPVEANFATAPTGFFVLCRSRQLGRKPLQGMFAEHPVVLFRDEAGAARALLDRCPHRGVALSQGVVMHGQIACPYHGYRFSGEGACVHIPGLSAEQRIPKALHTPCLQVVEQDGFVWVQHKMFGDERVPQRLPFFSHPDYHTTVWSLRTHGTLLDGLENFLDATHTHYVHAGLIRRDKARHRVAVHIRREGTRAEAHYVDTTTPQRTSSGLISRLLAHGIDGRWGRFLAPNIAQLEYRRGAQTAMIISALFTPTTQHELSVWAVVATKRVAYVPSWLVRAAIKPLFKLAILQDRRILGLQAQGRRAFPHAPHVVSPIDVLRPHIQHILQGGSARPFEKDLILEI